MRTDYCYGEYKHIKGDKEVYYVRKDADKERKRYAALNLTPEHKPRPKKVGGNVLSVLRSEYSSLISIIKSYAEKIELIMPMENAVIDIYTNDFIIIDRIGNAPRLDAISYSVGSIISKEKFGNLAVHKCIEHGNPAMMAGKEHFLKVLKTWASFSMPIHDPHGDIIAALSIVLPTKHANRNILNLLTVAMQGIEGKLELLDEQTNLAATNEMLTEFNAGMIKTASVLSHEIRNSLSTISAYVQLLQLQGSLDNRKGDRILTEISRTNKLLSKFSSLSEPSELELYEYSLNALLISAVNSLSPKARMSNIDIDLKLDEEILAMVSTEYMERVFINIIVNAIQAMEDDGGSLKISLHMAEDTKEKVYIIFEDTGPGISEDKLDDVFEFFYTTKSEGTGLGLAMCHHIIRSHGGEIKVESTKGVGAKFIITLPCIKAETTE